MEKTRISTYSCKNKFLSSNISGRAGVECLESKPDIATIQNGGNRSWTIWISRSRDRIHYLIGGCGQAESVWCKEENRSEFMERKALRESLCFALDNDYRDFLGLSPGLMSDERLLESMHETKSSSKFIPDEARRASLIWLAQHKPLE